MNHHIFSAIAHLNMYFSSCKKQSIAYSKLSLITITNNLIATSKVSKVWIFALIEEIHP